MNNANSRGQTLLARIYSEEYCCLNGYLRLCLARGETVANMAKNIGMSKDIIWYHIRQMKAGKNVCAKKADCLTPVIDEISKKL